MKISEHIALTVIALAVLASCDTSFHSGESGLAVSADWADTDDRSAAVERENLLIFNAATGAEAVNFSCCDARELGSRLFPLEAGDYAVTLFVNLAEPFSFSQDQATPDELSISLNGGTTPFHAYFGSGDVHVDGANNRVTEAQMSVRRILSEFAIEIEGAPEGLALDITVVNSSECLFPLRKNSEGQYGMMSSTAKEATITDVRLSGNERRSEIFRVMPTADGREYSIITMKLYFPGGTEQETMLEAPRMSVSGRYLINLKFSEIRPFMKLSGHCIDNWIEGWTYEGVITDPDTIDF